MKMNYNDAMRDTLSHVRRVGHLMLDITEKLQRRAMEHDDSKFSEEEFEIFAESTPKLKSLTYGSDEYYEARRELGTALEHHYAHNRHHPEFHKKGIKGMNLLDLMEMLADWKAASERHDDGCISTSIIHNAERFGYDEEMMHLLANTAIDLGWIIPGDFVVARHKTSVAIDEKMKYSENGVPILSLPKKLDALRYCALSENSKEDAVGHLLDLLAHLDKDGQLAAGYLQYPRTPIDSE